jgi:hypothetical protein
MGREIQKKVINCKCIQSYVQVISQIVDLNDTENIYCFRGQALSCWKLIPSFFRNQKLSDKSIEKTIYSELIQKFPSEFAKSIDEITFDDLAKMQHYSIPTKLLDISFNPLVALFFATETAKGKGRLKEGCVYIFKIPKRFEKFKTNEPVFKTDETKNDKKITLVKTSYSTERMQKQDGGFLYSENPETFDEISELVIHEIHIQNGPKKRIRKELEIMNISYSTLFPEISEFYKYITERFLK